MSKKIGRNNLCWCGSGKKYKKCHYGREREQEVTKQDIVKHLKRIHSKHECLHPDAPNGCSHKIKAHTVQRGGGLSKIARDGHVYTPYNVAPRFNDHFELKLEGIRKASTFSGMCGHHDNIFFEPIEEQPMSFTDEQVFLLTYRALSKELYIKRRVFESTPFQRRIDAGESVENQERIQSFLAHTELGTMGALVDLENSKAIMDRAFIQGNFPDIQYFIVEINKVPDILCSVSYTPHYDFEGEIIQDLYEMTHEGKIADWLTFSLLPNKDKGYALFSWYGNSETNLEFIRSLSSLNDSKIIHAIVRFTIGQFENVYIRPNWWESLSQTTQDKLLDRYKNYMSLTTPVNTNQFVDDGYKIVNWKVTNRRSNLRL